MTPIDVSGSITFVDIPCILSQMVRGATRYWCTNKQPLFLSILTV